MKRSENRKEQTLGLQKAALQKIDSAMVGPQKTHEQLVDELTTIMIEATGTQHMSARWVRRHFSGVAGVVSGTTSPFLVRDRNGSRIHFSPRSVRMPDKVGERAGIG
jgi:hypothetical protein